MNNLRLLLILFFLPFVSSLLLFDTAQSNNSHLTQNTAVSIRPLWRVSSHYETSRSTLTKEEVNAYLYKTLNISDHEIIIDGQTCFYTTLAIREVETLTYFKENFIFSSAEKITPEKTVQLIKTSCNFIGFSEYIKLKDGRIVVHINGVLFIFSPLVSY